MKFIHVPVLLHECMNYLITDKSGIYVDCTLGTGGHFSQIAMETHSNAVLIGFDADPKAIQYCQDTHKIIQKHLYINQNFENIRKYCFRNGYIKVDGILMDLGMSSFALEDNDRGLAFRHNGPLDMRFSPDIVQSAADFVNNADINEIRRVLWEYGEEKASAKIAREIEKIRSQKPIKTTEDLANIVKKFNPERFHNKALSRVFQALRIHINRELEVLQIALEQTTMMLKPAGRLAIISYHSLEDRIIKNFIKDKTTDCICPPELPICACSHKAVMKNLTRKPVLPSDEEIKTNNRSRSAKLRVVEML
ncbi:MAG: 16S rRNA (cytosine(1402)-N(4))-methyltransferase RsmH [Candidatus Marinimicrobia bacterium]|nr:16S rRNA (cytosine(1402)-N(4))-methyltransferase RsmH [Candidatus Neomarinimicrobiota bacterium]